MSRKRVLLYACLALAVPLPALALEAGSGAADLDVQTSLNGCGIGGGAIACSLDASFNRLEDAEYYTASVTAPDGSVSDLGTVAEGGGEGRASATLSVSFAGNGEYTVTISAWGYDEEGRPDRIGSEDAVTGGDAEGSQKGELQPVGPPADEGAPGAEVEEPVPGEPAPPVTEEPPECPELEAPAPPADPAADQPAEPLARDCIEPPPEVPPGPEDGQEPEPEPAPEPAPPSP
jgi:hypothetical protein